MLPGAVVHPLVRREGGGAGHVRLGGGGGGLHQGVMGEKRRIVGEREEAFLEMRASGRRNERGLSAIVSS